MVVERNHCFVSLMLSLKRLQFIYCRRDMALIAKVELLNNFIEIGGGVLWTHFFLENSVFE